MLLKVYRNILSYAIFFYEAIELMIQLFTRLPSPVMKQRSDQARTPWITWFTRFKSLLVAACLLATPWLSPAMALEPGQDPPRSHHTINAKADGSIPGDRTVVIVSQSAVHGRSLAQLIETATGKPVQVLRSQTYKPDASQYPIFVADDDSANEAVGSALDQLDIEGYVIDISKDRAWLAAGKQVTDTGSPVVWAQFAFARKFMGINYYFPGELGVVTPDKPIKLDLPAGQWVVNPDYKGRHWSGYAGAASAGWGVRASGGGGRYHFHHRFWDIFPSKTYGKTHPEYYPVINPDQPGYKHNNHPLYRDIPLGGRFVPAIGSTTNWQPCTSNPDVIRLTIEYVLAELDKHPKNPTVALGVNDNGGFCNCSECQKLTPPGVDPMIDVAQGYRYYLFYNQVADEVQKKYPDAKIGFLVYSSLTDWLPERLNPLLMPYTTMSMADMWDPAYKDRLMKSFETWPRVAHQFGIYEWMFGNGFAIPRLYLHNQAEGLKRIKELGASGFYAEAYPNYGLDGPKLWVVKELLWDTTQDVDVLIDQWCNDLFKSAGPAMRTYFDRLEQAWSEQKPTDDRRGGYRLWQLYNRQFAEVFPPAVCDEAWALLLKAREAASSDELVLKRIDYFQSAFAMTRTASSRYAAAMVGKSIKIGDVTKDDASAREMLKAYDQWLVAGSIDKAIDELFVKAPNSIQIMCYPHLIEGEIRRQLRLWDTDFPARVTLASAIVQQAAAELGANDLGKGIVKHAQLNDAIDKVLVDWKASKAAAADLSSLAKRMIITAKPMASAPKLDGVIEDAWGEPGFDGQFFAYPSLVNENPAGNKIWIRYDKEKLYIAGTLTQDNFKVNPKPLGHDEVLLRDKPDAKGNGTFDTSRYHDTFKYLYANKKAGDSDVNSIGIMLPHISLVMITAEGGMLDASGTSYGYSPKWDGVEFAVKLLEDKSGWSFEAIISKGADSQYPQPAGALWRRINFFRPVNGSLTAWTPGNPGTWSIDPRSTGYLLYE